MVTVVVGHTFADASRPEDSLAFAERATWCGHILGVEPLHVHLARDGRRLVAILDVPDVEALKARAVAVGLDASQVFQVTSHAAASRPGSGVVPSPNMTFAIVERAFPEPMSLEDIKAKQEVGRPCFEIRNARLLWSYLSTDRLRMICLFEAPDAEAVRQGNRQAGLPFQLVWSVAPLTRLPAPANAQITPIGPS